MMFVEFIPKALREYSPTIGAGINPVSLDHALTQSAAMSPPRIYLAGPEVFLSDALAMGARKAALCAAHGLEGVFPLDAQLDLAGLAKPEQARRISEANEGLMRSCAGLIANLTPFRGVSMDSGTAFEVGFMRALGRPVLGYTNVVADYRARAVVYRSAPPPLPDFDHPEADIEDFHGAENLMIEVAIVDSGGTVVRTAVPPGEEMRDLAGFEACLAQAARILGR
jgi:nucleoside 2-deoxyribosyltransferase